MTVSWPFCAPASPPDTGASTKPIPASPETAASSRASSAEAVVWSTSTEPARIAPITPSEAVVTARTSSSAPTIVNTTSASVAGTSRAGCNRAAVLVSPALRLVGGAVEHGHVVTGCDEMSSHRIAHDTETDEPDLHALLPTSLTSIEPPPHSLARGTTPRSVGATPRRDRRRLRLWEHASQSRDRPSRYRHRRT